MPATPRRAKKRSRKPPSPNSVLDRRALLQALDKAGLTIKALHIEAFYQAIHRQHYPDLSDFVDNYYRHEDEFQDSKLLPNKKRSTEMPQRPLKNNISSKKNKNKVQLPRALLQFLKETDSLVTVTSTVAQACTSADGTTTKLAIRLHDGQLVESVLMRYVTRDGSRASLCVSSQCGCAMGCVRTTWCCVHKSCCNESLALFRQVLFLILLTLSLAIPCSVYTRRPCYVTLSTKTDFLCNGYHGSIGQFNDG